MTMKILKTNIYRLKNGNVIDATDKNDALFWIDRARIWDHTHKPVPDLSDAVELDCEMLVRERISKVTKMTEIEGPMLYALTEGGTLVEARNMYAYSPSLKAWIRPDMAVIDALEASVISAEEAERLVKEGTTRDPHKPKGA